MKNEQQQEQQQIPFGNDNKKSRCPGLAESVPQRLKPRSIDCGYGTAEAVPLTKRELISGSLGRIRGCVKNKQPQEQTQISFGNDNKKGRFLRKEQQEKQNPFGMSAREADSLRE